MYSVRQEAVELGEHSDCAGFARRRRGSECIAWEIRIARMRGQTTTQSKIAGHGFEVMASWMWRFKFVTCR